MPRIHLAAFRLLQKLRLHACEVLLARDRSLPRHPDLIAEDFPMGTPASATLRATTALAAVDAVPAEGLVRVGVGGVGVGYGAHNPDSLWVEFKVMSTNKS